MKKIPTLFQRQDSGRYVIDQVTPGCEWVLEGQGVALRKFDGVCVKRDESGEWWARRTVNNYSDPLAAPTDCVLEEMDTTTGKAFGWVPSEMSSFHEVLGEVLDNGYSPTHGPGTYELMGPTINGNPEKLDWPALVKHSHAPRVWPLVGKPPYTFAWLREFMLTGTTHTFPLHAEGVVWYHASGDGRMVKLKRRDFPQPPQ